MDEEELEKILNQVRQGGSAGASAHTGNLTAWGKIIDFINNENQSFPWAPRTTVEERYNTPEGSKYWTPTEWLTDWVYKNPEIAEKIIMGGAGAAAGLPPELAMLSALAALQDFMPRLLEKHGFTPEHLPGGEGRGDESGKDVPIFVPYDPGEFIFDTPYPINPADSRSPTEPGIGASSQTAPSIFWIDRTHPDGGYWLEGGTSHWMDYPGGGYWSGGDIPDKAIEYYDSIPKLESDWQLEYDAAKEAFDKRNDEEERRHREEYDKMVADMLAEQEEAATGFRPAELEEELSKLRPDDFWTGLEKFLDSTVYNPIFDAPPYQSQGNPHIPDSFLQTLGELMDNQNAGSPVFGKNTRQIIDLLQGKPVDLNIFLNQNLPPEQVQPQIQYNPTVP